MSDLRHHILSVAPQVKAVEVPEWNTTVYLREISVADRLALWGKVDQTQTDTPLSVWVLVYALADAAGRRIFGDDDFDALSQKSAKVIKWLAELASEFNMLTSAAESDAKKPSETNPK